jgi:predicted ATPase
MEITFTHQGEFVLALEHFAKALLLYNPDRHRDDAFRYAQNPGVAMRCFASWALWFLGQPDRALELIENALTLARELSEPYGLAHALFFKAILHQLSREERQSQDLAEQAIAVSSEHGLVLYQAMATITRGWAMIEQGREQEAIGQMCNEEVIEQMRQGLAAHRATGAGVLCPHFLGLLAEALGKNSQADEVIGHRASGRFRYARELRRRSRRSFWGSIRRCPFRRR